MVFSGGNRDKRYLNFNANEECESDFVVARSHFPVGFLRFKYFDQNFKMLGLAYGDCNTHFPSLSFVNYKFIRLLAIRLIGIFTFYFDFATLTATLKSQVTKAFCVICLMVQLNFLDTFETDAS